MFKKIISNLTNNKNIYKFGVYELLVVSGSESSLIVSCAGVGNIQADTIKFEFKKSLEMVANDSHQIFIKDNSRSWYTNKKGRDALVSFLKKYVKNNHINQSTILGLSMGGYGALVIDSLMHFDRVAVLASRSCLKGSASFDSRNKKLINKVKPSQYDSIEKFVTDAKRVHMVFSMDDRSDLLHGYRAANLLPNINQFVVRGGHNIANEFGRQNQMVDLVKWMIGLNEEQEPIGFLPFSKRLFHICEHLVDKEYSLNSSLSDSTFLKASCFDIPVFLFESYFGRRLSELKKSSNLSSFSNELEALSVFPVTTNSYLTYQNTPNLFKFGWKIQETGNLLTRGFWHSINGRLVNYDRGFSYEVCLRIKAMSSNLSQCSIKIYSSLDTFDEFAIKADNKYKLIKSKIIFDSEGIFHITIDSKSPTNEGLGNLFELQGLFIRRV